MCLIIIKDRWQAVYLNNKTLHLIKFLRRHHSNYIFAFICENCLVVTPSSSRVIILYLKWLTCLCGVCRIRRTCFNCGGDHELSACTEPRNKQRIGENWRQFQKRKLSTVGPSQTRWSILSIACVVVMYTSRLVYWYSAIQWYCLQVKRSKFVRNYKRCDWEKTECFMLAVKKLWKSVKTWQRYGTFFTWLFYFEPSYARNLIQ